MFSPIPRNGRCTTSTGSTVTTFRRAGRVEQAPTARSRTSTLILADLILAVARARRAGERASAISSASFLALDAEARGASRSTSAGEGRVRRAETIDVRIPAGVANGGRVRVPGKGNSGTMGAPAGDLYLRVVVRRHEFFERRGNDLYTKIPVTVSEATLGAKIEVPTIDGRSIVRIPPGTNSGNTLRLKEKGVPSARNGARGDQYVEIQVLVPLPTDERVRNLMKELERVAPADPRKDLFAKAGV